jgi:choline dehydrogenase-like flavoprotein
MFGALMRVRSTGWITLEESTNTPSVALNMLSDERDVLAMREATSLLIEMVRRPAFTEISHAVTCDDVGTPLSVLEDMSSDQLQVWLRTHVGSYSHIGCSSKMGASTDEDAVVDTNGKIIGYDGVWVCDASIFPDLPTGNTHLPVVMMAERISTRIHAAVTAE